MKKIMFFMFVLCLTANISGLCCTTEIQADSLSQQNVSDCQIDHEMYKLVMDVFTVILDEYEKTVLFQNVIHSNPLVSPIDHPPK